MGIVQNQNKNIPPQQNNAGEEYSLNRHELEYILLLIKDSTFKGEELEKLYNLVYKLQQQYLNFK